MTPPKDLRLKLRFQPCLNPQCDRLAFVSLLRERYCCSTCYVACRTGLSIDRVAHSHQCNALYYLKKEMREMPIWNILREEVSWFAQRMEEVMRRHDPERGDGWKTAEVEDLHNLLLVEVTELASVDQAVYMTTHDHELEVVRKAANVANYAMMIACHQGMDTRVRMTPGINQPENADLLEAAWGIIANAHGGNWAIAGSDWQRAAERWRDLYHATLPEVSEQETMLKEAWKLLFSIRHGKMTEEWCEGMDAWCDRYHEKYTKDEDDAEVTATIKRAVGCDYVFSERQGACVLEFGHRGPHKVDGKLDATPIHRMTSDPERVEPPFNLSWVQSKTLPIMERLRQFEKALYGITRLPKREEPIHFSYHDVKALHTLLAEVLNSRKYLRESLREMLKEMV